MVSTIAMVAFPIALVIYAFSGCELRHRSAKAACRAGSVEPCLAVAKIYDDASDGLLGFLLSNVETARVHYDKACTLGSVAACDRLGALILHGADAARDSRFGAADAARAFDKACAGHLLDACHALGMLYVDGRGVDTDEAHAAQLFAQGCAGNDGNACYQLGVFTADGRGGLTADPARALALFAQSCHAEEHPAGACGAEFKYKNTGRFH